MADRSMDESFDFGITDTSVLGNRKAVEDFLSDTPLPENEEGIEEIDEEEETAKAAAAKKKGKTAPPVVTKKAAAPVNKQVVEDDELLAEGEEEEAETETDIEEEPEAKKDTPAKKEPVEENDYETLAKDLIRLGVFSQESEDGVVPKTGAELLAKFNKEKEAGAIQWIDGLLSRFGDDRRELFEAIYINGVDPREYLSVYADVQNLEGLDITKESNQELVFREFYKSIKFPPEKIEAKLQKSKDNGDLEEESKEFLSQLVDQKKEQLAEQESSKAAKLAAEQKADLEYKNSIGKVLTEKLKTKEFNGIPLTQELANKAYDFLYTKKYKTADGQLLTEFDKFTLETKRPENVEQRVLIALLKLTEFNFSKIEKRAVSKESNELFNTFAHRKAKKAEAAQTKQAASSPKDWFNL